MGIFDKKNFYKIEKDDLKDATLSSAGYEGLTKKRAFINILGARLAMKMLFEQKIEVDNVYSLYSIQSILQRFDIADIYCGSTKLDIRVVFDKEQIFIPKSQFENNLLPDLYLFLQISSDFSGVEFLGSIAPRQVNKANSNKDYYFVELDELIEPDLIKKTVESIDEKSRENASDIDIQTAQLMFLSLVDNEISKKDLQFLLDQLVNSFNLRESLVEFENFELISSKIVKDESIIQDNVLDIVGAQKAYEGEDLSPSNEKAEIIGEVLSDLIENEELKEEQSKNESKEHSIGDVIAGAAAGAVAGTVAGAIAGAGAAATDASLGLVPEVIPNIDISGNSLDINTNNGENKNDDDEFLNELKDNSTLTSENVDTNDVEDLFEVNNSDDNIELETIDANEENVIDISDDIVTQIDNNEDDLFSIIDSDDEMNSDNLADEKIELGNSENLLSQDIDELALVDDENALEANEFTAISKEISNENEIFENLNDVDDLTTETNNLILENDVDTNFDELSIENIETDKNDIDNNDLIELESLAEEPLEVTNELLPTETVNEDEIISEEPEITEAETELELESLTEEPLEVTNELPSTETVNEDEIISEEPEIIETENKKQSIISDSLADDTKSEDILEALPELEPLPTLEDINLDDNSSSINSKEDAIIDEPLNNDKLEEVVQNEPNIDASSEFLSTEIESESDLKSEVEPEQENKNIQFEEIKTDEAESPLADAGIPFEGLPELSLGYHDDIPDYLKNLTGESNLQTSENDNETEISAPEDQQVPSYMQEETETEQEQEQEQEENNVNTEIADDAPLVLLDDSNNESDYEQDNGSEDKIDYDDDDITLESFRGNSETKTTEEDFNNINEAIDDTDSFISEIDNFLNSIDDSSNLSSPSETEESEESNLEKELRDENSAIELTDLSNTDNSNEETSNDPLQVLFKKDDDNIDTLFPTGSKIVNVIKDNKKMVVAATVASVVITSLAIGTLISNNIHNKQIAAQNLELSQMQAEAEAKRRNEFNEDFQSSQSQETIPQTGDSLATSSANTSGISQNVEEAMSSAFSSEPINANVTKIAWEIPEKYAYNDAFRNYLQIAGKNLKLNLQNELLLSENMAYSDRVILNLVISKNGGIESSNIVRSSGSKSIDKIVLQSVNNTLIHLKMPVDEVKENSVDATLIISF